MRNGNSEKFHPGFRSLGNLARVDPKKCRVDRSHSLTRQFTHSRWAGACSLRLTHASLSASSGKTPPQDAADDQLIRLKPTTVVLHDRDGESMKRPIFRCSNHLYCPFPFPSREEGRCASPSFTSNTATSASMSFLLSPPHPPRGHLRCLCISVLRLYYTHPSVRSYL